MGSSIRSHNTTKNRLVCSDKSAGGAGLDGKTVTLCCQRRLCESIKATHLNTSDVLCPVFSQKDPSLTVICVRVCNAHANVLENTGEELKIG